jgi:hypothetical protein
LQKKWRATIEGHLTNLFEGLLNVVVVSQNHQDLPPDAKEKRRQSQFINFDVAKGKQK